MINNPFEQLSSQIGELTSEILTLRRELTEKKKEKYFTLKEAGEILGVSDQTIRRNIRRGNIKAHLLGKKTVIAYSELYDNLNVVKSIKYKR